MSYLKRAGYLYSERINVCVDMKEGTIRSAPAYKQFTERFFSDLKVVRYNNICSLIVASRKRQEKKKGYVFLGLHLEPFHQEFKKSLMFKN